MIKLGISAILYGIVLRLWARVAGVKEALPVLIKAGGASVTDGGPR